MNLDKLVGTAVHLQSIQARERMCNAGLRKDPRDSGEENVIARRRWEGEREQEGLRDKKILKDIVITVCGFLMSRYEEKFSEEYME